MLFWAFKRAPDRGIEPRARAWQARMLPTTPTGIKLCLIRASSCGPMAKACDYESRDWGFESLQECFCAECLNWLNTAQQRLTAVLSRTSSCAQWLRRVTTNHEIEGSSPSRNVFHCPTNRYNSQTHLTKYVYFSEVCYRHVNEVVSPMLNDSHGSQTYDNVSSVM